MPRRRGSAGRARCLGRLLAELSARRLPAPGINRQLRVRLAERSARPKALRAAGSSTGSPHRGPGAWHPPGEELSRLQGGSGQTALVAGSPSLDPKPPARSARR